MLGIKKKIQGGSYMINRTFEYEVMDEIMSHWSPRAFDSEKQVPESELRALLEAARYAPSCFNEQPWRYLIARDSEVRDKIIDSMTPGNKEWAPKAPVLMVILSKQTFAQNGKDNRWHQFDAGTSWGYLQLEAQRRGMITHAMGGFNSNKLRESLNIPDEYTIIALMALGYYGDPENLTDNYKAKENPSPRKSIDDIIFTL